MLATALERVAEPYGVEISWSFLQCFGCVALACTGGNLTGNADAGTLPGLRLTPLDPGAAPTGNRSFRARPRRAVFADQTVRRCGFAAVADVLPLCVVRV